MNSTKTAPKRRIQPGAARSARAAARSRKAGVEIGTESDAQVAKNAAKSRKTLGVDPKRLNTTGEAERSSDRGSLVSFRAEDLSS